MQKFVILGGGTAGWMAANILCKHLDPHRYSVHLIESPDIGTIGVGEGSTPHLKVFFDELGIAESDWMPACDATYKNGISFVNWTSHLAENRYFHPFPSYSDRQTAAAFLMHCHLKFQGVDVSTNPDDYFLAYELSKQHLSPKVHEGHASIPLNYAFHFDSHKLGQFLAKYAIKQGVNHIPAKVEQVIQHPDNSIASLALDNGDIVDGDWFIDASGFSGKLLQESLQVPFESFASALLNDSAIALPSHDVQPLSSETTATALKHGWAWRIPLTQRVGNGYVFSRAHSTFDEAERELKQHIGKDFSQSDARHIHMKVGQVKQAWKKNVIALGLAQGFIEPLEATALHLVLETLISFIAKFNQGDFEHSDKQAFNKGIYQRYHGIRDYIVCHYKVNTRHDSAYWQDARETPTYSEQLKEVLAVWDSGKDITPILKAHGMDKYYPAVSWYCLLAGYGRFSAKAPEVQNASHLQQAQQRLTQLKRFIQNTAKQFQAHASVVR